MLELHIFPIVFFCEMHDGKENICLGILKYVLFHNHSIAMSLWGIQAVIGGSITGSFRGNLWAVEG